MPVPTSSDIVSYDYAVVRVVPLVDREEFINAGVILFCRTRRFLAAAVNLDEARLLALAPDLDVNDVRCHLDLIPKICQGGEQAGPIGQQIQAERFHWLTAPRSAVIQCSPIHSGLCLDPESALNHLFETMVSPPAAPIG